jgi:hypothetical protein
VLPNIWDSGADERKALRATMHAATKFWVVLRTRRALVKAFNHEELNK